MKINLCSFFGSRFLTVILLTALVVSVWQTKKTDSSFSSVPPGRTVPTLAPVKLSAGQKHGKYSTNPPSSGWYSDRSIRNGIYTSPVADEQLVEALTRGTVVITYNCQYKSQIPTAPPALPATDSEEASATSLPDNQLNGLSGRKRQSPEEIRSILRQVNEQNRVCGELTTSLRNIVEKFAEERIILAPRPQLDNRIALVSWGIIDKFFFFNQNRIERFINAYRGKIPKV